MAVKLEKWPAYEVELPQGTGYQMIHRVNSIAEDGEVICESDYWGNEVYFVKDHFPGRPVMPGSLLLEAMAQAMTQAAQCNPRLRGRNFFITSDETKYRQTVEPPATFVYIGRITHINPERGGFAEVKAMVNGTVVAETKITFVVMRQ